MAERGHLCYRTHQLGGALGGAGRKMHKIKLADPAFIGQECTI